MFKLPSSNQNLSPHLPVFDFATSAKVLGSIFFSFLSTSRDRESFKPPEGTTPVSLNFSANIFHPPINPFPSRKIRQNLFASRSQTEQRRNLPALFERRSNQYFLPPSSQTRDQLLSSLPLQQASTPSNKLIRLASPNLIQEVSPLHFSQMHPLNFPPTLSTKSSKDLESTAKHLLPP